MYLEPITQFIKSEINRAPQKSISFARFMEIALYNSDLGYYATKEKTIGRQGDFITAPEISPLFAQTIAHQIKEFLKSGSYSFLELGAGSGVFARDLMKALNLEDALPSHYYILEISPLLRKQQQLLLKEMMPDLIDRFVWLEELPSQFEGIIFANEVLDALPFHCVYKETEQWQEKSVTYGENAFQWCLTKPSSELLQKCALIETEHVLPVGYETEINLLAENLTKKCVRSLKEGFILFFDYGYACSEYYHPDRRTGTLKCFHEHRHHDNPFLNIGSQDITSHVDFTSIVESAIKEGAELMGYTTQSAFLLGGGMLNFANKNTVSIDYLKDSQAIKLLTLPSHMGELIKVIGFKKNCDFKLESFSFMNRALQL